MYRNVVPTLLLATAIAVAIALRHSRRRAASNPSDAMTLRIYDVHDLLTDDFWRYDSEHLSVQARLDELRGLIHYQSGMNNFYEPPIIAPRPPPGDARVTTFSGRLCAIQTPIGQAQAQTLLEHLRLGNGSDTGDLQSLARLSVHIGDVEFRDTDLETALNVLASRSGADLLADWPSLEHLPTNEFPPEHRGINPATVVNLHLANSTLGEALDGICADLRRLLFVPSPINLTIAENPAGALVLTPSYRTRVEITTLPRFYRVDPLIGPSGRSPVRGSVRAGLVSLSGGSRPQLQSLALALQPFAPGADVGCFGSLLSVNGSVEGHQAILDVLDRLQHPIQISDAAAELPQPRPLPTVPVFSPPRRHSSIAETLALWQAAGAGHARVDLDPQDDAGFVQVMYFEYHNASLEKIANQIICSPLLVIPSTDRDDCVHVRRCQWERIPRVYDVSQILAHSDHWYVDPVGKDPFFPVLKEDQLIRLLDENVDHDNVHFGGSAITPVLATCWNGRLILREDPEIHARVVRFLDHLQRTGRASD